MLIFVCEKKIGHYFCGKVSMQHKNEMSNRVICRNGDTIPRGNVLIVFFSKMHNIFNQFCISLGALLLGLHRCDLH